MHPGLLSFNTFAQHLKTELTVHMTDSWLAEAWVASASMEWGLLEDPLLIRPQSEDHQQSGSVLYKQENWLGSKEAQMKGTGKGVGLVTETGKGTHRALSEDRVCDLRLIRTML